MKRCFLCKYTSFKVLGSFDSFFYLEFQMKNGYLSFYQITTFHNHFIFPSKYLHNLSSLSFVFARKNENLHKLQNTNTNLISSNDIPPINLIFFGNSHVLIAETKLIHCQNFCPLCQKKRTQLNTFGRILWTSCYF